MANIGDYLKSASKDVDILKQDVAIFKNLIKERKHPLDLVRELLSNAGAREVGATEIEISYTTDREGHVFTVEDNGCGMYFTGNKDVPGRLDRFLGLGLSAIVGQKSDEFSWKGLGSKLAYQSRRVEIETRHGKDPLYQVTVNEPWDTLGRNEIPRPRITEHKQADEPSGTKIKVIGHPPHRQEQAFGFDEIRTFLLHRTFAGFTRWRDQPPRITLSVLGRTETIEFGFPEFRDIVWPNAIFLDKSGKRLLVNIKTDAPKIGLLVMKGFLTWEAEKYGLGKSKLNTGLILSSRGIPYFELNMEDYGARSVIRANPGVDKTCLVVECDGIHSEMNISRSDLVDSAETLEFKKAVEKLFAKLESSPDYLEFRQLPKLEKRGSSASLLADEKREIEAEDQNWVIFQRDGQRPMVLMREPKNESEVVALIWKLEAVGGLPFEKFQTLAYVGAHKGPDLLVNFQEDKTSEPVRGAVVEVERNFYNYTSHGHGPSQYPKIICWDTPTSGRKVRLNRTSRKYKFTVNMEEYQLHVFVLKLLDGVSVVTRREMKEMGIDI